MNILIISDDYSNVILATKCLHGSRITKIQIERAENIIFEKSSLDYGNVGQGNLTLRIFSSKNVIINSQDSPNFELLKIDLHLKDVELCKMSGVFISNINVLSTISLKRNSTYFIPFIVCLVLSIVMFSTIIGTSLWVCQLRKRLFRIRR